MRLTPEQIRWFRVQRSGLGPVPFGSPEAAAAGVAGVQAQILPAAALAFWNRSREGACTYAELTARLHDDRTLVKLWGQRHTLHVYATEDWPVIHAAFAERSTWWEREIKLRGKPEDLEVYRAAIARVRGMLQERGSMGRRELRAISGELPAALLSPWGGVFAELVRGGYACHARWEGGEARYAAREHWLPALAWDPPSAEDANVILARRYLRAYGPAPASDLAYWRGAPVSAARRWLDCLAPELMEVDAAGTRSFALAADLPDLAADPPKRSEWPVRLLGRFDPLLLGHKQKDWIVPPAHYARVWRPAGHIEAIVLVHGQAAATWRYDRAGGQLVITVRPFQETLPARVQSAIRRQARRVAKFFGLPLGEIRTGGA